MLLYAELGMIMVLLVLICVALILIRKQIELASVMKSLDEALNKKIADELKLLAEQERLNNLTKGYCETLETYRVKTVHEMPGIMQ